MSLAVLLLARGASLLASWMVSTLTPNMVYSIGGSMVAMAFLILCRSLPALPANAVLVVLERRGIRPLRILQMSEVMRLLLYVPLLFVTGQAWLYVLSASWALVEALVTPCYFSLVPSLCRPEQVSRATNRLLTIVNAALVCGPLASSALFSAWGLRPTIACALALMVVSSVAAGHLMPQAQEPQGEGSSAGDGMSAEGDGLGGRGEARPEDTAHRPHAWALLRSLGASTAALLTIDATSGFAFGSLNALMPIASQVQALDPTVLYGWFLGALMAGMLMGNVLFELVGYRFETGRLYRALTVGALTTYLLFGVLVGPLLRCALLLVTGLGNSMQDVCLMTALQRRAATGRGASLIALRESLGSVAVTVSTVYVGACVSVLGVPGLVLVAYAVALVASLPSFARLRRGEPSR